MERIFFIKNGDLEEINELLAKGAKVKMIKPVCETITSYGCAGGETSAYNHDWYVGKIYAYVVLEFD